MRHTTSRLAAGVLICLLATDFGAGERRGSSEGSSHRSAPAAVVDFSQLERSVRPFIASIDRPRQDDRRGGERIFATITNAGTATSRAACVVSEVDADGASVWSSSLETSPIAPGMSTRVVGISPDVGKASAIDRYRITCGPPE